MDTKQYATVTIPSNHRCERTTDHEARSWPVPITVRVSRSVTTNKNRGSFRATGPWTFIYGPYAYSLEPWLGFVPANERFGQRDFVRKQEAV